MSPKPAFASADEYERWINRRIGQEVQRLRTQAGLSAYKLGQICGVTDQTVLNIEQARRPCGCMTGSLARIAHFFGLRLRDLIARAEDG